MLKNTTPRRGKAAMTGDSYRPGGSRIAKGNALRVIVQEDGNQVDLIGATHYVKRLNYVKRHYNVQGTRA